MNVDTYLEKTYAGVLGKLIGVYLGRPFEMWSHQRILRELGTVEYYLHERFGTPLVVTDDDVGGTFTFVRALADNGFDPGVTPAQIGQAWLNYIIENRTILWWGGTGNSTEHTAYLHLKRGVAAPMSGSIALNGATVAEQIGAQIFIDGWALVAAGDPELAADLARRAASVSHDGVAVHAAQLLAAMEALAYVEDDVDTLLDTSLALVPSDSLLQRLVNDVRTWRHVDDDWLATRRRIEASYGTDTYGGNCHVVPNHAIVLMSMLYGADDFQRGLSIACTAGWDTDCNAGNVGCLIGIRGGLAAIEAGPDWRGPVADRLYLSSADGQRCITDAVAQTYLLSEAWHRLRGCTPPAPPKRGARFHFALPGSTQGFRASDTASAELVRITNRPHPARPEDRCLAIAFDRLAPGRVARVGTATFIPPEALAMPGYELIASPTLEAGHTVEVEVIAEALNTRAVDACLYARAYDGNDEPRTLEGPTVPLAPGEHHRLTWRIEHDPNEPLFEVGLQLSAHLRADGVVYLDHLDWHGTPEATYRRPPGNGSLWRRAWVNAMDHVGHNWPEAFHLSQDHGRGLLIRGGRDWRDYTVSSRLRASVAPSFGIAAHVQGLERYYALEVTAAQTVRLVKASAGRQVVAEAPFTWEHDQPLDFSLTVTAGELRGHVANSPILTFVDTVGPLDSGGIALVCEQGHLATDAVTIAPHYPEGHPHRC